MRILQASVNDGADPQRREGGLSEEGFDLDPAALLGRVRFVLVRPRGAVNIGLAARALKNMGIGRLDLVAPRGYRERSVRRLSSRAVDVVERLVVHPDLPAALRDAVLVAAATGRGGQERGPFLEPAALGRLFARAPGDGDLVVVLGPEEHGLAASDLDHCPLRVAIPADRAYPSLNLALAVQVLAYELRLAALEQRQTDGEAAGSPADVGPEPVRASRQVMESFYVHLGEVLGRVGFLNPQNPTHIQRAFRRLFDRAALDEREVRILRGLLSNVQRLLGERD